MSKSIKNIWVSDEYFLASVDSGKFATKWTNGNKRGMFRTTLEAIESFDPTLQGNYVEFEGGKYQMSQESGRVDTETSKARLVHKLSIYIALSQMKIKEEQKINLVIGCPSNLCKNQVERQEYAEYIKGDGVIEISINKKDYTFYINDVLVLPEGSGIIFRDENYDKYSEELIGVVGIGGLNMQGTIYMECDPVDSSIFTLNSGTDNLYVEIKSALNRMKKDGVTNNYSDLQISYKIKYLNDQEKNGLSDEEIQVIKTIMRKQLDKAFAEMNSKQWNINGMKLVFTGGGSLLMKPVIEEMGYEISEDPVFDDCIGFYEVGEEYYGN